MAKEKTLDAAANKRMMFSYLGMLGAAAYFVEPKETYVSVQNAMYVSFGVYGVFYILFTFLNDMFFADNFKKGPKDNFGYIFMKIKNFIIVKVNYRVTIRKYKVFTFQIVNN